MADIKVEEVKTLETTFMVQLRVMNPNDLDLEIKGLACDLELDGSQFASGMQSEKRVIPAYGSALIPVKVYASILNMVSSILQRVQEGQGTSGQEALTYGLSGHVRVSGGGLSRNLPFTSSGELNLQQLNSSK